MRRQDRPERVNRTLVSLIGLILLLLGAYGLARSYGLFGDDRARQPLLTSDMRDWVSDQSWFWPAIAAACAVLAYLGWRWFRYQIRPTPRVPDMELEPDGTTGSTRLRPAGAANALAADIERNSGVQSASARLLSDGGEPELDVRVDLFDDADIPAVRQHIEEVAFERFRQALQVDGVRAHVQLRPGEPQGRVVR